MKVYLASSVAEKRAPKDKQKSPSAQTATAKKKWRYFFIIITIINLILFVYFVYSSIEQVRINTLYEAHPWEQYGFEHTSDLNPDYGSVMINIAILATFVADIVGIIAAIAGKVRGKLRVAYISSIVLIILANVCCPVIMKIDLETRAKWYDYTVCEPNYGKNATLKDQDKWVKADYFPSSYTCK